MTAPPTTGQRTLDPSMTAPEGPAGAPPEPPPELLDPPSPQPAAGRLEDRQTRWFEIRERAIVQDRARRAEAPAEDASANPKP